MSSGTKPEDKRAIGGWWRRWFFALLLVAALVFAALHWGDVEEFAELISKAQPIWLLGALALQLLTYLSLSTEWWLVLKRGGNPLPLSALFPITITKLFADQVVPTAGVSGNVLLVDRLKVRGVSRPNAIAAVILAILSYYASYAVVALAAVILLWLRSEISWPLIAAISVFFVVAAAIPAGTLWLQGKGRDAIPAWLERWSGPKELLKMLGEAPEELVRDPRLISQLALLNAAVFLLDSATMMLCLLALGGEAPFDAAFVALVIASIVVTIGPIPLGLGSFEAASIGTLRLMGIPFEAAVSATLLYRGFALWLPLVGGLILSRRELHQR
jgi:uncharacterized membrane protein YbhN (UPF0104 family)